ncbi:AraC family transcriptional regulator [Lactiplantibacillus carotarum]|uniref:AraC family transcriptional regulator n=1 Tax=Lactiplantibacillus carotarum TaxID=2993456 RepID=UPI00298F222F|nr:AraC family transcriptional regulator [Lactiplantibacillus carotarum]
MVNEHHENVVPNIDVGVRFYESNVTNSGYVPFHWHSSIELVCVMAGELRFNLNGTTKVVGANQFMAISSGVVHDVTNTPNHAFVLQIPLAFMAPYVAHPDQLNIRVDESESTAYRAIIADFLKLNQINTQRHAGYLFDIGAVVLHLLKLLVNNFATPAVTSHQITSHLKDLIAFVNANYAQPLTVHDLAQRFGYNPNYLSRLFKQQVGISLIDYLYKIRLNAFHRDLITTKRPISDLMKKHGLRNARTTRMLFKQLYNQLPSQVRRDAQHN